MREIRAILAAVLEVPKWWIGTMLALGLVSCFAVSHPASGGLRVSFDVSTTAVALFGLVWLPALLQLVALTRRQVQGRWVRGLIRGAFRDLR